jgi:hypothetical protein
MSILAICAVIGLILSLAGNATRIGDSVRFSLDASQAQARAVEILRQQNVDTDRYHRAATIQYRFDPLVNEYLRRSIGVAAANDIYQTQAPAAYWTVRFFRDSEKEEYLVVLHPDGSLHAVHHTLPEEARGANLAKDEAQQRAETYLMQSKFLDLSQWNLVDSHSEKLPARTDHSFTWEQKRAVASLENDEGAHVRMEVQVRGEEASGYRVYVHLPEEWVRRQNEDTLLTTAHSNGLFGVIGAFIVTVLAVFLKDLKQPSAAAVPWRRLANWSLPILVSFIAWVITNIPKYMTGYQTETSLSTYLTSTVISFLLGSAALSAMVFILLGLAWFFLAGSYGASELPGWRGMPSLYYRDALISGIGGFAILAGVARLQIVIEKIWPVLHFGFQASVPEILDAAPPALQVMARAVMFGFIAIGVLALAAGFTAGYMRETWKQISALGVLAILAAPRWGSPGELLQNTLVGWAALLLLWWVVHRILRFNLLAYFLTTSLLLLANAAADLLRQPNTYFRANGAVLIVAIFMLLAWPLIAWRSGRARRSADTPRDISPTPA